MLWISIIIKIKWPDDHSFSNGNPYTWKEIFYRETSMKDLFQYKDIITVPGKTIILKQAPGLLIHFLSASQLGYIPLPGSFPPGGGWVMCVEYDRDSWYESPTKMNVSLQSSWKVQILLGLEDQWNIFLLNP